MLEVLYDTATKEVRGWCADPDQFGNFTSSPDEEVVILPIDPPTFESFIYYLDLVNQTIYGDPIPPDPDYLRACELLATSPKVITMPEIWELLRIFGRKLGFERR